MRHMKTLAWSVIVVAMAMALASCSEDDTMQPNPTPTSFTVRVENVAPFTNAKTGFFATKTGGASPGPLAPGDAYDVAFTAGPSHRLVFATMFGQSNDWFFAPDPDGIALYASGTPISGDVTDQVYLWDAGTEVDEEPAVGPHTGPNQAMSTDGPGAVDPNANVRKVAEMAMLSDGSTFQRPTVAEMILVTITPGPGARDFVLHIENVADDGSTLQTSEGAKPVRVSPGVWALGTGNDPVFTSGAADRGEGLEGLAESGATGDLATALMGQAGVATPLSPGVWVLHTTSSPLFAAGSVDRGEGVQDVAERGDIAPLSASLATMLPGGVSSYGSFSVAVGAAGPGPIFTGGAYEFEVDAVPGDYLSFVLMYGASNDWFFGTGEAGIALFTGGNPVNGDVTGDIYLWDSGTELSEEPGIGPNIGAPDGPDDPDDLVRIVPAGEYATPVTDHLQVTITQ